MTHYLNIVPLREPNDVGELDDAGRVQIEFGVVAWKRPSATWLEDLVGILSDASITNVLAGPKAVVPREGAWLSIKATGGTAPVGTHDGGTAAYRRPGAQIIARASSYAAALALAEAAYAAIVAVRNQDVA